MKCTKSNLRFVCVSMFVVPTLIWPNLAVAIGTGLFAILSYYAVLENQV